MPEERFIKRLERMPKGIHTSNSILPRVRNLRKKEPMWKDFLDCLHNSKGILIQLCGSLLDDLNPKTKKRQGTIKEGLRNGWTVNVPCLTRDSHPPTSVHKTGKTGIFLLLMNSPECPFMCVQPKAKRGKEQSRKAWGTAWWPKMLCQRRQLGKSWEAIHSEKIQSDYSKNQVNLNQCAYLPEHW